MKYAQEELIFDEDLEDIIISIPMYYGADINLFFNGDEWECSVRLEEDAADYNAKILRGRAKDGSPEYAINDAIWNAFVGKPNGGDGYEIDQYSQQEVDALVKRARDWFYENEELLTASRRRARVRFNPRRGKATRRR